MDALHVKLSVAKRTLGEGARLGRRGDEVGRVVAVLLCDLAAEMAMKAVALTLGHSVENLNFPTLVPLISSKVPSAERMRVLRARVRNPAQHGGAVPRQVDVDEMAVAAETCLGESFAACGHDYTTFTLVALVENATLRSLLDEAAGLAARNPRASLATTTRAFRWLEHLVMFAAADAHGIDTWWSYDPRNGLESEVVTADGRERTTRELLTIVAGTALGLDIPRRIRLLNLLRAAVDDTAPADVRDACRTRRDRC